MADRWLCSQYMWSTYFYPRDRTSTTKQASRGSFLGCALIAELKLSFMVFVWPQVHPTTTALFCFCQLNYVYLFDLFEEKIWAK